MCDFCAFGWRRKRLAKGVAHVEFQSDDRDGSSFRAPTTRRATDDRRRMRADQSPRHPDFVEVVLEPLATRHDAGESDAQLSLELYNTLHTWAVAFAGAQCARLPAHADRNEVLSQVLQLTWRACQRIDWNQYAAWPTYLESKVSRARIEAARSDDWLSRRERVRRRRYQEELAVREQTEQRTLTVAERGAVASAVAPSSARVDWTKALLSSHHPSTVAEVPDVVDTTTVEDQVESRHLDAIRVQCLMEWLRIVGSQNPNLAAELARWAQASDSRDRGLPARLAQRIEPFTPLLLAMLGEAA